MESAPIVKIDADRNHEIETLYLEDLEAFVENNEQCNTTKLQFGTPTMYDEQYAWALRIIAHLYSKKISRPKILIFLPGINELMVMNDKLMEWIAV